VNNFYSRPEYYFERWLTPALRQAIRQHPVVVLTGARQVGKSTLLLNAAPFRDWRYHSLDDLDTLRQARAAPEALWAGADQVVLDEVQRAPELLSAVKLAVDRQPRARRFVLSGSANLLLMSQVSETLAGRAVYFMLDPMALGEINRRPPSTLLSDALAGRWPDAGARGVVPPDPARLMLRGLLPALLPLEAPPAWVQWWDGYVATYLERDLRQVAQVEALPDFRRLMQLAALRSGQLLNQSETGRDAQLSQPTAHRYLNLLETTHLFARLPPYVANRTSRLVKSPKAFWADPGLAVFLAGYFTEADLRAAHEFGAFFETLIYLHLRTLAGLMTPPAQLFFWRTRAGAEVDFVVAHGRRLIALEVKLAERPGYGDTAGLQAFLAEHPTAAGGLLLHAGREVRRLGDRIVAVPWTMLTG